MDEDLFDALGFRWDRAVICALAVPRADAMDRAVSGYADALPRFVWDAAQLEGNPLTAPEVQALINGATVGGRRLSDQQQVLNLVESSKRLAQMVRARAFALSKQVSDELHSLIARDEALEWGHFRGEGSMTTTPSVHLGEYGRHVPPATEVGGRTLRDMHRIGVRAIIDGIDGAFEQALVYCLFACRKQFYFDGNKRTSRAVMNGHLLSHGIDAISVPAARRVEYDTKMIEFYRRAEATEMLIFFGTCLLSDTVNRRQPRRPVRQLGH